MVEIIGATCYAAENPIFSLYVVPTQPLRSPSLPTNQKAAQIRTLTDKNNLLNRYWDVVRGFRKGFRKNICDALDWGFFGLLQNAR